MAEDAGTIFAEVRVQLADLKKDVVSVKTQMDKIAKSADDTSKKSQNSFKKFFGFLKSSGLGVVGGLSVAVAGVTKAVRESTKAAADAQEVFSKYNTVFESIQGTAEKTAETFADSFDLAESTAKELLGTTGDLLTGFGATEDVALNLSERVNVLAGDLASFSNIEGGVAQASRALTAALLGEREQAKQLGIVIREADVSQKLLEKGQQNLTGQSLLLAKAEATLELAYQQSQKAIGDYARTADSAANASKRFEQSSKGLKEAFGTLFLGTATKIKNAFSDIADALTETIDAYNDFQAAQEREKEGVAVAQDYVVLLNEALKARRENTNSIVGGNIALENQLGILGKTDAQIAEMITNYQREQIAIEERNKANEEERKRAAAAAEEARRREEERQKNVATRLKIQKELEDQLFVIAQREKQAAESGEEYDAVKERQAAAQSALNKLFQEGFRLEGTGVQAFIDKYGELLAATGDLKTETQLFFESFKEGAEGTASLVFETIQNMYESLEQAQLEHLEKQAQQERDNRQALLDEELAAIEKRKKSQIDALGIVEETELMRLENELEAARQRNDEEAAEELAKQIERQKLIEQQKSIEEAAIKEVEAAKKKAAADEEARQKKLDEEKKQIQRNAALRERRIRSFEAAIDTAGAVIKFLVDPGGIAGAAMSIGAGITGAAQIAAINSAPLPSFATGGIVMPSDGGQVVRVAENGSPELMLNGGPEGSGMLRAFAQEIAASMGGAGTTVVQYNTINADSEKNLRRAARELYPYLEEERTRNGG